MRRSEMQLEPADSGWLKPAADKIAPQRTAILLRESDELSRFELIVNKS